MPRRVLAATLLCLLVGPAVRAAEPLEFHVTFDRAVSTEPFTGRVYVLLTKKQPAELPAGPDWFHPEPMFARDVKDWRSGDRAVLGAEALSYPMPLAKLPRGVWWAQAVLDFDRGEQSFSAADGNAYSKAVRLDLDPATSGPVSLAIDQFYRARAFPETDRLKLVDIESKSLSTFHRRPVHLRAAVMLPRSFADNPTRRYPVVYEIPGFDGNHFLALKLPLGLTDVAGVEMLHVVLDPGCRWGHHVFANSDNNGPCGQALIDELIPYLERKYRGLGVPAARFVTGHSSGGWSSLWLQVAYPETFGGVWSTAPDPVDFRDFQRINLYKEGSNVFVDEDNKPRPIARRGGVPVLFFRSFSDMEEVMGHGGQLGSFEAAFSPRGADGQPKRLWERRTGAIDPDVARSWERYDIRIILERNWEALEPRLAGKLHVYMGGEDTFYLDGATRRLKESLKKLGSDAVVEIFPERDHRTLVDRQLQERIATEMAEQFRKNYRNE